MGKQEQDQEEPEEESAQVDKNKHVPQVLTRRARNEERASMEAKKWEQEKLGRRRRSPEHAAATCPGNKSRRSSQLAECGCWDCERRSDREAVMEEHKEEAGPRRISTCNLDS